MKVDVLVSHALADQGRVAPFVRALEAAGLSVGWDSQRHAGDRWYDVTDYELEDTRAVLVFWSERSVGHLGVRVDARRAGDRLIAVRLDQAEPPYPFDLANSADLSGGGEESEALALKQVVAAAQWLARGEGGLAEPGAVDLARAAMPSKTVRLGYAGRVRSALLWLESRLENRAYVGRGAWFRAFTPELLKWMIPLSLAYLLLAVGAQWALTGAAARFGDATLLPAAAHFWWERAAAAVLVGALAAMWAAHLAGEMKGVALWADRAISAAALAAAVALAASAAAVVGRFFGGVAEAFAPGGPGSADAVIALCAVLVLIALYFVQNALGRMLGAPVAMFCFYLLLVGGALLAALNLTDPAMLRAGLFGVMRVSVLALLLVLPALCGLFLFFSIGLTRFYLAQSVRARTMMGRVLLTALEALTGALTAVGLSAAAIWAAHLYNVRDAQGAPLLDFGAMLREAPSLFSNHLWLYAVLCAPMLPTLVHAFLIGRAFMDSAVWGVVRFASGPAYGPERAARWRRGSARRDVSVAGWAMGAMVSGVVLGGGYLLLTAGGEQSLAAQLASAAALWAHLIGAAAAAGG